MRSRGNVRPDGGRKPPCGARLGLSDGRQQLDAATPAAAPERPVFLWMERHRHLFKDKMKRGEVVVVVNPDHPSPSLTEFIGGLDFDGLFVDCEHGVASAERVQDMCRAARAAGIQSIVRPETDAHHLIARYLDAGAGGVILPHVETAAAARRTVQTVRIHPAARL